MSDKSPEKQWVEEFQKGSIRALGRLITLSENQDDRLLNLMVPLYPKIGNARVMGITGPPGAGKSTIISQFVSQIRKAGKRVAVIAVDPMSPFTGGALLGDRIRLADHFNDEGVFIRSLSSRGRLGGLSASTRQVVHLVDAFGFDYVIVETVGVGQNEVDVKDIVDMVTLVLVPESGDGIQVLKAGIIEAADCYVVNKSERNGAGKLKSEIELMLDMSGRKEVGLKEVTHDRTASYEELFSLIDNYFVTHADLIKKRRQNFGIRTAELLMENKILEELRVWLSKSFSKDANPYEFVKSYLKNHKGSLFSSNE